MKLPSNQSIVPFKATHIIYCINDVGFKFPVGATVGSYDALLLVRALKQSHGKGDNYNYEYSEA